MKANNTKWTKQVYRKIKNKNKNYTKYAIKYQKTYVIYHQQVMKAEIYQTSKEYIELTL